MMTKNYGDSVEINHNPNKPFIPDSPYRILSIDSSELSKAYALLKFMKHQRPNIDKI